MRPRNRTLWLLVILLPLVGFVVAVRLRVVREFHAPAGDGLQYYRISQQLVQGGRFAFDPAPAPLTYARLPGYPLFLAHVAVRARATLEEHLRLATRWNVALDLGTALLLLLCARERRLPRGVGPIALLLLLCSPPLLLLSAYGLSEPLATFLATLALYLALRAATRRSLGAAALCGAACGAGLLVRLDMLALLPAVLLTLWLCGGEAGWARRQRAWALLLTLLAAGACFSPWPLRNLLRFRAAHPEGAAWLRQDGRPLPTGILLWTRTWASGALGEPYLMLLLAHEAPLDARNPNILRPNMVHDEAERQRLVALFARYNRERLSPAVDQAFRALALERAARDPLLVLVELPWRRMRVLWQPLPEHEFPLVAPVLGLPPRRARLADVDHAVYLAALAGLLLLVARREQRASALCLLGFVAARCALFTFAHAMPNQRYLVEAYPVLVLLAASALPGLWGLVKARGGAAARA